MNEIEVTIGHRIEDYFSWENGSPRVNTKYIGGQTDNGVCYKDLDAWERGGYDDVIYISESNLEEPIHNNYGRWTKPSLLAHIRTHIEDYYKDESFFAEMIADDKFIEMLAYDILYNADWQDLSTLLDDYDNNGDWIIDNWVDWENKQN